MWRKYFSFSVALSALFSPPARSTPPVQEDPTALTGFLNKKLDAQHGGRRYVLYVPENYTPEQAWPLIVFLHGAGERGDDGLVQSEVGLGPAIRQHPERFPALVLMPQCPRERVWDGEILKGVEQAMAETQRDYAIDTQRIYLTGLSMGGYGTWIWGPVKDDTFAALMPICGGGDISKIKSLGKEFIGTEFGTLEERVPRLAQMPTYAFHGADDDVVPPERSREMVQLVEAAGGHVHYVEFEDTAHNSWDKAYATVEALEWLFEQRKP
jgi:predicted peptidase